MAAEIRAFNLISDKALDDRAVEELAHAVSFAAVLGGEALGALTRRESQMLFGDLLEPIEAHAARSRAGVRFSVALHNDPEEILGVLFATIPSAVALADVFFGGPGEGTDRRLTNIEARAISDSLASVLGPVVSVLNAREKCQVTLTHLKDAPLPGSDLVELSMQLTVGEVSIDASLFAPNPDGAVGDDDSSSREQMAETIKDMPVPVDIDLASVQMAAGEVQALANGDVIVFDASPDNEAIARSGERDLLRGRVGESSGRRFLEVTEVLVSS